MHQVPDSVPKHIAIIMDGNGRWARRRGLPRLEGHRAGAAAVQRALENCIERGVKYLTLFSFSSENWKRSESEVGGLMELFTEVLTSNLDFLMAKNVRMRAIGDLAKLPPTVLDAFSKNIDETEECAGLTLVLAVSYGAREEIATAARKIAEQVQAGQIAPQDITPELFQESLWTKGIPDPELLIRTSGEMRISNFMLWQVAYSEIVVCPELWPDFDGKVLDRCLAEYSRRERRFGLTSEQIKSLSETPATTC